MTDEEIRSEVAKMVTHMFCSANGKGIITDQKFDENSKILFNYIKFGEPFPSRTTREKES